MSDVTRSLEELEPWRAVQQAFAVLDAERVRLQTAIEEVRRELELARAADRALPSLGDLIRGALADTAAMEASYRATIDQLLADADASAARMLDAALTPVR